MKTLFTLILLISLPLTTLAQDNSEVKDDSKTTELIIDSDSTKTSTKPETSAFNRSTVKAKAIQLNYKKSFELISIKAYRKSLQIKVKTIKNC